MLKKVILTVLSLCLILTMGVVAEKENPAEETTTEITTQQPQDGAGFRQGGRGNMSMPPEGMNRGQRPEGNFTPPQDAGTFTPPEGMFAPAQSSEETNNTEALAPQTDQSTPQEETQMSDGNAPFGGQMPGGFDGFPDNRQNLNQDTNVQQPQGFTGFVKTYSTPITSVILLAFAFVFVIFYRRKNY